VFSDLRSLKRACSVVNSSKRFFRISFNPDFYTRTSISFLPTNCVTAASVSIIRWSASVSNCFFCGHVGAAEEVGDAIIRLRGVAAPILWEI
jgi:hypothetical protein